MSAILNGMRPTLHPRLVNGRFGDPPCSFKHSTVLMRCCSTWVI
ncbi:hypothetical protein BV98_001393 [Sphingobium herbicidovorans NBRC 16415]|uniref:Uncharacterized protein n=1 Tax=Sphingobium herbicidovorans (strain ATCC 700291 / DSM 11019 / CCUG 56400 / KCTC 2939 / LMG 18315 / NBRC 16415 / MH) TaxID=1219045 RepID=A0A086PBU4_SPHHM|nr:hypothetical protein BV98_001393 [Sphingobium herbicidovorans NBRC 16415]